MIVKIPLYFEVDLKEKPEEVQMFLEVVQDRITEKLLKLTSIDFSYFVPYDNYKIGEIQSHKNGLNIVMKLMTKQAVLRQTMKRVKDATK
jgi:hypothetical protein